MSDILRNSWTAAHNIATTLQLWNAKLQALEPKVAPRGWRRLHPIAGQSDGHELQLAIRYNYKTSLSLKPRFGHQSAGCADGSSVVTDHSAEGLLVRALSNCTYRHCPTDLNALDISDTSRTMQSEGLVLVVCTDIKANIKLTISFLLWEDNLLFYPGWSECPRVGITSLSSNDRHPDENLNNKSLNIVEHRTNVFTARRTSLPKV